MELLHQALHPGASPVLAVFQTSKHLHLPHTPSHANDIDSCHPSRVFHYLITVWKPLRVENINVQWLMVKGFMSSLEQSRIPGGCWHRAGQRMLGVVDIGQGRGWWGFRPTKGHCDMERQGQRLWQSLLRLKPRFFDYLGHGDMGHITHHCHS